MEWKWICRDCKKEYPESGEGLQEGKNPSGLPLKLCTCGGVVDLSRKEYAVSKTLRALWGKSKPITWAEFIQGGKLKKVTRRGRKNSVK
jgi:hypothetical protein